MASTIKPHELARWLGVSPTTIRMWASLEFGRYLSPSGAGGEGRWRVFSEHDARILAYVQMLKQQGLRVEEIHAALARMQADGWQGLPDMPPAPVGVEPERLIPEKAAEKIILSQQSAAGNHIAVLQSQIAELKSELVAERERRDSEVKELTRKLAEAETELRLWREGWRKPE